jgi:hypothetical protein
VQCYKVPYGVLNARYVCQFWRHSLIIKLLDFSPSDNTMFYIFIRKGHGSYGG